MEYPIISEYIEAIKIAKDNLKVLNYLSPVLDENGKVVMSSGNFAVVFKMRDERDGKLYALKCFLKEQEGRAEAYHKICKTLRYENAPCFTKFEYYDDELFVNSSQTDEETFPVLLMDWVKDSSSDEVDGKADYVVEKASGKDWSEYYDFLIRFKNGCPLYFKFGDNKDEVMVCVPRYMYDDYPNYYYRNDEKPFGRVRIPSIINYRNRKYNVVRIDKWAFKDCTSLLQIEIPNSIQEIGDEAFMRCTSLVEIRISNLVKMIGSRAFDGCVSLVEIEIPNSMQTIGEDVFRDCISLVEIEIPDSVNEICSGAFLGCTSLVEIEMPNSVQKIGSSAFLGCTSLVEITIPNSVRMIGESVFNGCISLTQVDIANSIQKIDSFAFSGCTSLVEIEIPNSVKEIGWSVFEGCTSLVQIEIPDSVQMIGEGSFANTSVRIINHSCNYIVEDGVLYTKDKKEIVYVPNDIRTLTIPNSVQEIGCKSFLGCTSLVEIEIPNSVQTISEWAFYSCTSLVQISIPNSVEKIGCKAFSECISLVEIEIPNSIQTIEKWVFERCTSLVEIEIPNSIQTISEWAFNSCTSLKAIKISNSVRTIGYCAFSGCTSLAQISIPNSVDEINVGAFLGCTSLVEIEIPNSVQTIGPHAFENCTSLVEIDIPTSVMKIGGSAFEGCTLLKEVVIHNSKVEYENDSLPSYTKITYVDDYVIESYPRDMQNINYDFLVQFWSGSQLFVKLGDNDGEVLLFAPKKNYYSQLSNNKRISGKMKIPSIINYQNREYKIVGIGDGTFIGCTSLTQIEIPNSVREIGREAFRGCTSLKEVILHNRNVTYNEGLFRSFPPYTKITYVDD